MGAGRIKLSEKYQTEREEIHKIHNELKMDIITEKSKFFLSDLIASHKNLDAVVLGCTELPLVVHQENSLLPIIDPILLQTGAAVDFVLAS